MAKKKKPNIWGAIKKVASKTVASAKSIGRKVINSDAFKSYEKITNQIAKSTLTAVASTVGIPPEFTKKIVDARARAVDHVRGLAFGVKKKTPLIMPEDPQEISASAPSEPSKTYSTIGSVEYSEPTTEKEPISREKKKYSLTPEWFNGFIRAIKTKKEKSR